MSCDTSADRRPEAAPITVCICTHERPEYLRDCLDGLATQTVGPGGFDILVVDSGSSNAASMAIAGIVAGIPNARLLRLDRPGLSLARNSGARFVGAGYIAYLDDDAIPNPDWIAAIRRAIEKYSPALIGGAILPLWEAPLPRWWPARLLGVLSIIEAPGVGEYGHPGAAAALEPYGANMILHVPSLLARGGFLESIGRQGGVLLSDEEKVLAWRMQRAGWRVLYDSGIVVHHQIQAARLTPDWLLSRMYWQGMSRVHSGRQTGGAAALWREAARRLAALILLAPAALVPTRSVRFIAVRWRWAYARGFLRAFLRGAGRRMVGNRPATPEPLRAWHMPIRAP